MRLFFMTPGQISRGILSNLIWKKYLRRHLVKKPSLPPTHSTPFFSLHAFAASSLPPCRASFASVESVKAASDVYIPVAGTVKEVNKKLGDDPSLVNKSAEGDAWFAKVTIANPKDLDSLLDDAAYKAFLKSEGH